MFNRTGLSCFGRVVRFQDVVLSTVFAVAFGFIAGLTKTAFGIVAETNSAGLDPIATGVVLAAILLLFWVTLPLQGKGLRDVDAADFLLLGLFAVGAMLGLAELTRPAAHYVIEAAQPAILAGFALRTHSAHKERHAG
jgi:hypothetical protein